MSYMSNSIKLCRKMRTIRFKQQSGQSSNFSLKWLIMERTLHLQCSPERSSNSQIVQNPFMFERTLY